MNLEDKKSNNRSVKSCLDCQFCQKTRGYGTPFYCTHPDTKDRYSGLMMPCSTARHKDLGRCQPEGIYFLISKEHQEYLMLKLAEQAQLLNMME